MTDIIQDTDGDTYMGGAIDASPGRDAYLDIYHINGQTTAEIYDNDKDDSNPVAMVRLDPDGIDRLIAALQAAQARHTLERIKDYQQTHKEERP
jgi:hypothetical protein